MNKNNALPIGTGLGLLIGTIIGYLNNNLELWIPIGTSVGILLGSTWNLKSKEKIRDNNYIINKKKPKG